MKNRHGWKVLYSAVYVIVRVFPKRGGKLLDAIILGLAENYIVRFLVELKSKRALKNFSSPSRVCIISDVNLGDAIFNTATALGVRKRFPDARIDVIASVQSSRLTKENFFIDHVYGIFTTVPYPSAEDCERVREVIRSGDYDVIVNFCPFLSRKKLGVSKSVAVLGPSCLAILLLDRYKKSSPNIVSAMHDIIFELFGPGVDSKRVALEGATIFLNPFAVSDAQKFFEDHHLNPSRPKILINPDTTSQFTRMPIDLQVAILNSLAHESADLLLGAGHSEKGIEEKILACVSDHARKKITVVPKTVALETYCAIVDACDVFITGDTGPLHIAAARKYTHDGTPLRNKTSVIGIFGATPARIYGYDSSQKGFSAANQDAPSHTFVGPCSSRTIMYMNKLFIRETNPSIFFQGLDVGEITKILAQNLCHNSAALVTLSKPEKMMEEYVQQLG